MPPSSSPRLLAPSLMLLLLLLPITSSAASLSRIVTSSRFEHDHLGDLSKHLSVEEDEDVKSHDRMKCWCDKNIAARGEVVDSLKSEVQLLSNDIARQTAVNEQLRIEVGSHERDLQTEQTSLDTVNVLRSKDAKKASDDAQQHEESIAAIDAAMRALDGPGGGSKLVLEALRSMKVRGGGGSGLGRVQASASQLLLQVQGRLRGASSPEVIRGVLREMRDSFSRNLEEIKQNENDRLSRHSGLSEAKAAEIAAIKRQHLDKQKRLAEGKVDVTRNQEVMTRVEKLVEDSLTFLAATRSMCDRDEAAFQERQRERQGEIVALSSAQAALAGAQLLSVAAGRGEAAERLCRLAEDTSEHEWRQTVRKLCEQAKAGKLQEVAEAAEQWEGELEAAKAASTQERLRCQQAMHKVSILSEEATAQSEVVDSDMKAMNYFIDGLVAQASAARESSTNLAEASTDRHRLLNEVQAFAVRSEDVLTAAAASASHPAGSMLRDAAGHARRLRDVAASFSAASTSDVDKVSGILGSLQSDTQKALIPLRLAHADAEESEVALHEEQRMGKRLATLDVHCDVAALDVRIKRLGYYVEQLGVAEQALDRDALNP
eukprot:TRINITY_DN4431_c0_g1_i2.p1 TRINITY_DN4431_c0_g1~~TRINITY_DN4431_c0_g1_i2.p1  ORF type:complete len:603 (+),score=145.97 TRINITY_DN4431_c0_g1_i2:135-1943(+)